MYLALLLAQTAFAEAPPGASVSAAGHDCVFYLGPKADNGYNHINVECYWPEITVAQADPLIADFGAHDRIFRSATVSDVVGEENGFTLVRQVHEAKGLSPREVVLKFKREAVSGGYRYWWVKHENQPPLSSAKHVEIAYDDGHFLVTNNPSGGVKVEYHLLYDPGGRVPKFIVNWFQTDGVMDVMLDLRTYLNR